MDHEKLETLINEMDEYLSIKTKRETMDEVTEKELEEKVQEIGGDDGFWKSDNEKAVRESIRELVQRGFTLEGAFLFVEGLWVSAADEYGN